MVDYKDFLIFTKWLTKVGFSYIDKDKDKNMKDHYLYVNNKRVTIVTFEKFYGKDPNVPESGELTGMFFDSNSSHESESSGDFENLKKFIIDRNKGINRDEIIERLIE